MRGPDRRQAPRRAEEVALHYATQALLDAALTVVDAASTGDTGTMPALRDAAAAYRLAEDGVAQANAARAVHDHHPDGTVTPSRDDGLPVGGRYQARGWTDPISFD